MRINIWWHKDYISRLVRSIIDIDEDALLYTLAFLTSFSRVLVAAEVTLGEKYTS